MAEFKLSIGDPKTKRTFKAELKGSDAEQLIGKKIGDAFRGELIGLGGFEFKITGGSDKAGFPMFPDLEGQGRRRLILDGSKPGYNAPKKFSGIRARKLVRGNTIDSDIAQVNCKIVKWGAADLLKHFGIKEEKPEEKKEEKTEQKKEEEGKSEEEKAEEKKEAIKEKKEEELKAGEPKG